MARSTKIAIAAIQVLHVIFIIIEAVRTMKLGTFVASANLGTVTAASLLAVIAMRGAFTTKFPFAAIA